MTDHLWSPVMRSKKTVIPEEVNFQFYHEKLSMVQAKLDGHRRERTGLRDCKKPVIRRHKVMLRRRQQALVLRSTWWRVGDELEEGLCSNY